MSDNGKLEMRAMPAKDHCESCDPAFSCWANPETCRKPDCDHDWRLQDDSFDHEFGTEVIRYWLCHKCDSTKPTCDADFGNPEP